MRFILAAFCTATLKPAMQDVLPRVRVFIAALASIAAIGVVGEHAFPRSPTSASLLLLLVVLVTGSFSRLSDAVVVSMVAALALDFYFLPPVGVLTIDDPQGWLALIVFIVVSITASNLSDRLRRQRDELIQQRLETEKLHALSRSMLLSGSPDEVKRFIIEKALELFALHEFALFESATGQIYRSHENSSLDGERLKRAARLNISEDTPGGIVEPLTLGNVTLGSMGMLAGEIAVPRRIVTAIANTVAVGLAQAQAQRTSGQAEAVRRSEELKSIMIDALAHDLKSPLTSIEASAEVLAEGPQISPQQQAELLSIIREESRGLRRLIEEAIHMARINAERLKLESKPESVHGLIDEALASLGDRVSGRKMIIDLEADLPTVAVDRHLMSQAIKQLIDNALKYSPSNGPVIISGKGSPEEVTVFVRDNGPGLTEMEQARVFDKFYRGRYDRSAVQGTGMGLSIAKEIVEAHGGSVGVRSRVGQGSEFYIALRTRTEWR